MNTVFNKYRVPKAHAADFMRIQAAAGQISKREGALDYATYAPNDSQIHKLFDEMTQLIDIGRVLRGVFELAA